jgi:F-type H+-transporting ATPase subunit delta
MAEPSTIARPYAEAVFGLADAQGKLAEWSGALANLAAVGADDRVHAAIGDPNLSPAQVAGLFLSILAGKLSGDAENLVRVLAENARLDVLPQIRAHYEVLRNEREGVVEAEVHTAFDLDAAQLADLVAWLERKTGRRVRARVHLDRELIAGVKIALGDKVIDGSARAQLGALEAALKA